MEVEKIDGGVERTVLIGMILSTPVLAQIYPKYHEGLFETQWGSLLGRWTINHYEKYRQAPGKAIKAIYEQWASAESRDKELIKSIRILLASLSEEAGHVDEWNTQFIVDQAGWLFNRNNLAQLTNDLSAALADGRIGEAQEKVQTWNKVELGLGSGVNIFESPELFQAAIQEKLSKPILIYPDAVGEFLGDTFDRENFVAFEASDKKGKSAQLLDASWRGVLQHRRVAYFEAGDMSLTQVIRRLMVRVAQRPLKAGRILVPHSITYDASDDIAHVGHSEVVFDDDLDWEMAWAKLEGYRKKLKPEYQPFKISCHSNGSLSVIDIQSILEEWQRTEGWVPDIVCVDYADILKPISPKLDERGRTNESWMALRGLAQQWHCLVLTATQADADAYEAHTLRKSNFSGDKRKNAHVTAMLGINATDSELERGVRRWNFLVNRDRYTNESKCIHIAGCMSIMNPVMKSCV